MNRPTQLAVASLLALPSALAAQAAFEGAVTVRLTSGTTTAEPVFHVKGSRTRMEFNMAGAQAYQIIDLSKDQLITVVPSQRMYMTMDIKEAAKAAPVPQTPTAGYKVEETGRKETIAGISCEHYRMIDADGQREADVCLARGIGTFMGFGGGAPGRPGGMPGLPPEMRELAAKFKDGAFILKAEMKEGGRTIGSMEVTKVERKKVDDAMFVPPAGFQAMDMSGMMPPQRKPPA
ncbi:MAG: DUF4412 domain-containing protein [Gemmatimonadales bacterium]